MAHNQESDLELTVQESAALLKLEVTLLNLAEISYTRLQSDGNMETHAKQEAIVIVDSLQQIIAEHDIPSETYESLIDSYVGKLRDNFRTQVVETALEGQSGPNRERARKLEYMSSLYIEILARIQNVEQQMQKGLKKIHEVYIGLRPHVEGGWIVHPGDAEFSAATREILGHIKRYKIPRTEYMELIRGYLDDNRGRQEIFSDKSIYGDQGKSDLAYLKKVEGYIKNLLHDLE